jgi:hypothetical protein
MKKLIVAIMSSILVGLLVWGATRYTMSLLPREVIIKQIIPPSMIGMGGCSGELYDTQGQAHEELFAVDYTGPAPLFEVDWSTLPITISSQLNSCYRPTNFIPSTFVRKGKTVYPLYFDAQISEHKIRVGESETIQIRAQISDTFVSGAHPIRITSGEMLSSTFTLEAPNFSFNPQPKLSHPESIGIKQPIRQAWAIAPEENAVGKQDLLVTLSIEYSDGYTTGFRAPIELEVRPFIGLNPTFLAIMTAAGIFILQSLGIVKSLLEIWPKRETEELKQIKVLIDRADSTATTEKDQTGEHKLE